MTEEQIPDLDYRFEFQPTEEDLKSPLFNTIWETIKRWDISKNSNGMYSSATGTHVMYIIQALRKAGLA